MATNTLVPKRRSGAPRTLPVPLGGGPERAAAQPRPGPSHATLSETDAHLHRSYALVERLRRAVAARTAGVL